MLNRTPSQKSLRRPYLTNNRVKLIQGGAAYFDLLQLLIAEAKSTIHLQVYIYEEDDTGRRIATALLAAAARGVKIYILVDGYASRDLSQSFIELFGHAGIHFQNFEPIFQSKHFYFGRRLHHKVVVIDDVQCMVAGLNITDRYNDTVDAIAWLDWALYAEGPVAESLARVCMRRLKTPVAVPEDGYAPNLVIPGLVLNCEVRVSVNDWVRRKREITRSYLEMFQDASKSIIIMSPYFLPGEFIRRRMRQAVKRGVKIQVIQTGVSDVAVSKYAERYLYRWLLHNKIEIYEYQKTVLHGKLAVCDNRWITIGSYNVNNLSAYASVELNLDINDSRVATKAANELNEIMLIDCVRVTEDRYDKATTLLDRLLQPIAYHSLRVILFVFTFYFKQRE